jgi:hypothetical protein
LPEVKDMEKEILKGKKNFTVKLSLSLCGREFHASNNRIRNANSLQTDEKVKKRFSFSKHSGIVKYIYF